MGVGRWARARRMAVYDTIVVGLGAMGSAAALELARRGRRVLGLERFDIPHSRGSSHGHSRMIRLCYYEHADYVPLLRRAYELWRELERASGQKLLHITGGVYMGGAASEFVTGSRRAAEAHGLAHEMLTRDELAARFPQFRVPEDFAALYEPTAGFLVPERVLAAQANMALRHGAELHGNEMVLGWGSTGSGAWARTERGRYEAGSLVLCAGAWAGEVVREMGVPIRATRQVLGWVWPRRPEMFEMGRLPVWAIENTGGTVHYGFPMAGPGEELAGVAPGFKIAHHFHGRETDPDRNAWEAVAADEEDFRPVLRRFIPDADGALLAMRVCMYECSPDSHFIIDRHPRHANVVIACGFSGHGFKFASVVGEVLADLAIDGATRHPIGFLSLGRFGARG